MSHQRLMAELEVELETHIWSSQLGRAVLTKSKRDPAQRSPPTHFFLQHVFPLLPHPPHQLRQLGNPVPGLDLLHCCIEQREGSCAAHPRAVTRNQCKARLRAHRAQSFTPVAAGSLPAVYDNGCVQGSLVQIMCMHLLDEAQQIAGAVWQASAGKGQVGSRPEVRPSALDPTTQNSEHTTQAKWGSGGAQESA